jgi:hypothetical protein
LATKILLLALFLLPAGTLLAQKKDILFILDASQSTGRQLEGKWIS